MQQSAPGGLAALLTPDGAEQFLRSAWTDTVLCLHTERVGWPDFLNMQDVWADPARIQQLHGGSLQVTRGALGQYPGTGVRLDAWVEDLGLACLLSDLRASLPAAAAWLRELERDLGIPEGCARLSAFVNPPGVGLGAHCDPREHLLIHVAGRKRIRVLANPAGRYVSASHAALRTPSAEECVQYPKGLPTWPQLPDEAAEHMLVPGSVLWMPRGTYHETRGEGDAVSTSLVVQLDLQSCADVLLGYLRRYLTQDERWRMPVAALAAPAAQTEREQTLRGLLTDLGARLPQLSAAQILDGAARRCGRAIQPHERYARNPSLRVSSLAQPGGALRLCITPAHGRGRTQSVELGSAATQLAQALAEIAEPLSFADITARFSDWDPSSLAAITAFLVRHEVWIPLRTEPYRA